MSPAYLRRLRLTYRSDASDEPDALQRVAARHAAMSKTRLMDLAAVATSLSYVDREELDALALRAIEDTNPGFDPLQIGEYSDQEWMGITNAAKGKYFEYLVVDRLNAGEVVGDLYLVDGATAELAGSLTQPGWDVRILDRNGAEVELLQLKATDSAGYIRETIERYPEIRILTTEEAMQGVGSDTMVLDAQMSEADLTEVVDQTLRGLDPGVLDHFWEAFNPLLPALVIASTQGYQVAIGKQAVNDAFVMASNRVARGLAAGSVGAMLKVATGSVVVAASASFLTGLWFDRLRNVEAMCDFIRGLNRRQQARSDFVMQLAGSPL